MKLTRVLIVSFLLLGATVAANADTVNYRAMADGATGESAWNTLSVTTVGGIKVDAVATNPPGGFAYLDRNNAGLGVCGALNALGLTQVDTATNSGTNLCNPGSDDNVTAGEALRFTFDQNVWVEKIWFNNNHDGDHTLVNDTISIGGSNYTFGAGDADNAFPGAGNWVASSGWHVTSGTNFDIAFVAGAPVPDSNFYVSAMQFRVPEPTSLSLTGLGLLLGVVMVRRRFTQ